MSNDLPQVLDALRDHVVALAGAGGPRPPARIRVEASGAAVELEWDVVGTDRGTSGAVAARPAPANVPATMPVAPPAEPAPAAPAAVDGHVLTAPTVGVFYRAPEPGASPFVAEGDLVTAGQQVGIVEAMKLMIPVEADRGGRVAEVRCPDNSPVEFGAPLFVLVDAVPTATG
jgi:acetyl-CoA carboxylase biotin carboxyl carrier protein